MRRMALAIALGAAAMTVPAATGAGAVNVSIQGGTLTIVGSPDDDDISISSAGSNALGPTTRVTGGGADMVAGDGCQGFGDPNGPANDNSVFCPTNDVLRIQVDLLDGDDDFANGQNFDGTVNGGGGADGIDAGRGAGIITGGAGSDEVRVGGTGADGPNVIDGGDGDDLVVVGAAGNADDVRGGPGLDTASYAGHAAVAVAADDLPNDGSPNEGDNIRPDVEKVIGGSFDDALTGNGGPNTLDGAGGTDRLDGLGGDDTLIGGPGTNDATFGGPGNDAILLRDGLVDACPNGGAGTNTLDLDLVDLGLVIGRTFIPRCILVRSPSLIPRDILLGGAVDEGPNVRMTVPPPAVRRAGVRVRLACPAALRKPCAGPLRVFTLRGTRALGSIAYSIRPGRARVLFVPLDARARTAALAARALRIVSVERGRSKLGPKTTIRFVAPRGR